jgi:tight adherence protein B
MLAVAALSYAAILLTTARRTGLVRALEPYTQNAAEAGGSARKTMLADTSRLRTAVEVTARVARRARLMPHVEAWLDRADLGLRPAEGLFFYAAGVVAVTGLCLVAWRRPVPALAGLIVTAAVPVVFLRMAGTRRRRAFAAQLPDILRMLASALRSGRSLVQALQDVADEADDPIGLELRKVLGQARLGRPVEDSLEDMADRMGSADCQFAVTAIRIQRQIGGNLAELLGTVADTMVSRRRLRGEVKALTAEGRASAIVLGILPVGIGVAVSVINPGYLSPLFHEPLGQSMLIGAALVAGAGFLWMKKIVDIEL